MFFELFLICALPYVLSEDVPIGALFENDDNLEKAFNFAIEDINKNDNDAEFTFTAVVQNNLTKYNTYAVMKNACTILEDGVVAIFGPKTFENIEVVQSICDYKEIPHIVTRWNYWSQRGQIMVNMYPYPHQLSKAYYEIVSSKDWKTFTVLYEDNESLLRISSLIEHAQDIGIAIQILQLDQYNSGNYRETMKTLKLTGQQYFIIDCHIDNLYEVMSQLQQAGLMNENFNLFLTNLDAHTVNLTPFQYSNANITGIRLINPYKDYVQTTTQEYFKEDIDIFKASGWKLRLETALVIDALHMFTEVFKERQKTSSVRIMMNNNSFPCSESSSWEHGYSILNMIRTTEPYGMLRLTTDTVSGNDMYEGYAVDLIDALAKMEGFNYTFVVRQDKSSGNFDKETKQWTGMIKDLLNHVADLAICDFTITSEREEVVDFTVPFMTLGVSILFRKPEDAPPSFFSFADPFGLDTWVCMGCSFLITSLALYLIGRLCADEWTNPFPCIEEPEYLVNQFSLNNSLWFSTGAVLAQGSEIAPIAFSSRTCAAFWWYFCLIMNASYTANLAAFLATQNPIKLFTDLDSLYHNKHGIKYGAKLGGATIRYFANAENESLLWKVGQYLGDHPELLPTENDDGVLRAEQELYAFFMESASIEYATQRHCTLQKYGDNLDSKGYGIAMRKGSLYRKRLTLALLKLQQNHILDDLKKKWWEDRRGGGACQGDTEPDAAEPMKMVNVEGCFYCTIYGTLIAVILVLIEHLLHIIRVGKKTKLPFKEVFIREWHAYIDFNNASKANLMIEEKSQDEDSQKGEEAIEEQQEEQKKSKSKTKSHNSRSRSSSISRARLRQKRKSAMMRGKSTSPMPYGFMIPGSEESFKS
ncbi:glutamate receptor ionotropic, kainate 1-like isoform X3 [Diabrotica virgifera virgifera]|uniref:Glutamate receptor ionotropic, kainate 2-like n=1 Tax=Diabrotica virgifera virgifera TaxID=50390 RepID=A0ABM5JU59_DIAVI|nr:glutamate receptor ionotropic, kainate 1-like isoform X3 [Diabrotica virgifera virgifera]